jgi:hypothetical protein
MVLLRVRLFAVALIGKREFADLVRTLCKSTDAGRAAAEASVFARPPMWLRRGDVDDQ